MSLFKTPIGILTAACCTLAFCGMLSSPAGAQTEFSEAASLKNPYETRHENSSAASYHNLSFDGAYSSESGHESDIESNIVASCGDEDCDLIGCTCCGRREVDVEVGAKAPIIDGIGWVFGIPRKILLWDCRADNHCVSYDTVDEVASYVDFRGLHDTKVRVNQYDPGGEWKRLAANKEVGAGWRYTVGALSTLGYTIFPGRIFGHDNYNPYTNTLSVYSDAPPLALAEAAYAKDVHQRNYPGTYATAQHLPMVAMWHETLATKDVLRYSAVRGTDDEQAKVQRLLYARYGMELGGAVGNVVAASGAEALFPAAGAVGGHTAASVKQAVHSQRRRR